MTRGKVCSSLADYTMMYSMTPLFFKKKEKKTTHICRKETVTMSGQSKYRQFTS